MSTTPHPGLTGLHMAMAEIERMLDCANNDDSTPTGETEGLEIALNQIKNLYADVLAGMFPVEKSEIQEVIENSDRYLHIVKNLTINVRPGSSFMVGIKIPKHYKVRVTGLDHCIDRLMAVESLDNAMELVKELSEQDKPDKCGLCNGPMGVGWSHNFNGKGDCIPF